MSRKRTQALPRTPPSAPASPPAAAEATRWRRLASLVLACNRALLGTRDEAALLKAVCDLLVRRGAYRAAWICLASGTEAAGFRLRAQSGRATGAEASRRIACARSPQAGCPLAAPAADPSGKEARRPRRGAPAAPHETAAESSPPPLILPLKGKEAVLGMLHVAFRPGADVLPAELQVLAEIADTIAVRIEGLRAGWRHRQAKNAMIDTLKRLHVSVQATPLVAIQSLDRFGVVRQWNEASTGLYGFTHQQAVDRRLADLLFERELAPAFERVVEQAWRTGEGTPATEWQVLCADGSTRWVFASLIPIREQAEVVELFCLEVDITERRQAERALRDSEERYRNLVDAAPLAVLVHRAGTVRFANSAALELLGARQPDELCWRPLASLIHPESQNAFEELARAEASRPIELQLIRLDGGVVDAEVAALPLRWQDEPAEQWLVRDVTRANRMQHELKAARGKLARIFECSPAGILVCSLPEHRVLEANAAFLRLVGYDREAVTGRTLAELGIWREDQAARVQPPGRRTAGATPSFEVDLQPRRGPPRHAFVSVDDFAFGAQPCRLLILIDVTEQRRLEDQLQETQKLEAMGVLARGVAHDLNNILTVIQGHQSMIRLGRTLSPQAEDSLAGIAEAVERASELTRQLLTFSRKRPLEPRRLEVNEFLGGLAPMLRRMLGGTIELQLRCAPRLGPIWADPSMLEQVIVNLAVNARDAMRQGGQLTLATELRFVRNPPADRPPHAAAGDYLCLSVHDTGQGIPAENLARVFDPFFTTKGARHGTGLGLTTARNIVQQHQGWIEVDSRETGGTTFRLYLPAVAGPVPAPARAKRAPPAAAIRGTILLVDDEAAVRELARQALERHGYRVLAAESGPAAARLWRKHAPEIQLLFADFNLPGAMDGSALAQQLRAERPDLRVILSTGYGADLDAGQLHALSDVRVLPKPFSPDALARYVRECLAER